MYRKCNYRLLVVPPFFTYIVVLSILGLAALPNYAQVYFELHVYINIFR